jgi:hypothetical protein
MDRLGDHQAKTSTIFIKMCGVNKHALGKKLPLVLMSSFALVCNAYMFSRHLKMLLERVRVRRLQACFFFWSSHDL